MEQSFRYYFMTPLHTEILTGSHGVEVTGVDSMEKLDFMRSLGFDKVIDYRQEDFTRSETRYDLILDAKTNRSPFDYSRVLSPTGRYVTVGGLVSKLLKVVMFGPFITMISKKSMRVVALKPNENLSYMNQLFEAGKIKPVMEMFHTLDDVPRAMQYFGTGNHKGKVVIKLQ
jgi:NADPH:quinone reductase-like Zn-dependent oxidoreductase